MHMYYSKAFKLYTDVIGISSAAESMSPQRLIPSTTAEPSSAIATDTSLQPSPTSTGSTDNLLCMCV